MSTPFPTSISPAKVSPRPVFAVAQFDNPLDLTTEVQASNAFRWEIDITMQPMSPIEAADFGALVQAMAGGVGTFTFNLTPWAPGWTPAPGERTFRFAKNDIGWDAHLARKIGFQFSAIEDV